MLPLPPIFESTYRVKHFGPRMQSFISHMLSALKHSGRQPAGKETNPTHHDDDGAGGDDDDDNGGGDE